MYADFERYKALDRDLQIRELVSQFSGLIYVPDLRDGVVANSNAIRDSLGVTVNIDNATCILNAFPSTVYNCYFIPGYLTSTSNLNGNILVNDITYFDLESLVTQLDPKYWYPNTYPTSAWFRARQAPFQLSYCFHLGSAKIYTTTADYFSYTESETFIINLVQKYKATTPLLNVNVQSSLANMTYEPYTASPISGVQGLTKNTVINYVKRFPARLV
ncbi:hypothetical protein LC613_28715 [Nostoc sphaeroides CHAB 2801]|uniref:hypothetical protein n=1 Tax=Nostoc sphaeroides TaxID=446679 RepID=UPI000E53317F|nr:hypothetical protein [Nostoc sphaeroides]MCC5631703.1 hypothetical protein [Nostoc sphaeroides CHAB 2801]